MRAKAFVHLSNQGVILNNETFLLTTNIENEELPFNAIYKQLGISYPKFHKMDSLSKLGFLGVEILKKEIDLKIYDSDRVAQLFQNNHSSLDTDLKHQEYLNTNKMPSPAVFVYTLPNIVMGEIAIRNKLYGENLFILAENFSPKNWLSLVKIQLELGKADAVMGGWIDLFKNKFNLRLYFLDNSEEDRIYRVE
jgi:hypothetical protein